MYKDEGFKVRLAKALGYIGIGCIIGFIAGSLITAEISHRKVVDTAPIPLTGEYTVVLMQTERLLPSGEIEVLSSKVLDIRR